MANLNIFDFANSRYIRAHDTQARPEHGPYEYQQPPPNISYLGTMHSSYNNATNTVFDIEVKYQAQIQAHEYQPTSSNILYLPVLGTTDSFYTTAFMALQQIIKYQKKLAYNQYYCNRQDQFD